MQRAVHGAHAPGECSDTGAELGGALAKLLLAVACAAQAAVQLVQAQGQLGHVVAHRRAHQQAAVGLLLEGQDAGVERLAALLQVKQRLVQIIVAGGQRFGPRIEGREL